MAILFQGLKLKAAQQDWRVYTKINKGYWQRVSREQVGIDSSKLAFSDSTPCPLEAVE